MADLKTTYKDDVLNTSANDKRKYNMITNDDGTVSLEDVTEYSQVGDSFGAADINTTNKKVNEIDSSLKGKVGNFTSGNYKAVTGLAYDATNKKLGLKVGADTVIHFSSVSDLDLLWTNPNPDNTFPAQTLSIDSTGYNYIGISLYDPPQQQISIVKKADTNMFICGGEQSGGGGMYRGRFITSISDSNIVFGAGIVFHTGGANANANHGRPYKIYGIKIKE